MPRTSTEHPCNCLRDVATSVHVGIRIGSIVVNCADLETMTDFWTQALGLVPSSRDPGDDFPENTYVVMRDPEGNEFCVCSLSLSSRP